MTPCGRLYDKTLQIRQRGVSWLPDLWGPGGDGEPLWRLEFQYRREALVEFNLRGVPETLASLQDLWRYATSDWLSLRTPTPNRQRTRWPLDPVWEEVKAVEIVPSSTGASADRCTRPVCSGSSLQLVQAFRHMRRCRGSSTWSRR